MSDELTTSPSGKRPKTSVAADPVSALQLEIAELEYEHAEEKKKRANAEVRVRAIIKEIEAKRKKLIEVLTAK